MSDVTTPKEPAAEEEGAERSVDGALAQELVERARSEGVELVGPGGLLTGSDEDGAGDGARGGAGRAPRLPEARGRGPQHGQLAQRDEVEDGADRGRRGRARGAARPGRVVRAEDRQEAAAADERRRRAGDLAVARRASPPARSPRTSPTCTAPRSRKDTISPDHRRGVEELAGWQSRPLDSVYPVVFIDAIHVKIRDGKVANRPSTPSSASPSTASATSSGSGSATARRARSTGIRCSPRS